MGRAGRYREHSEECLAFSKSIADPIWRAQLVAMAAQWREHAVWASEIAARAQQTPGTAGRVKRMKSPAATRA
jgi:hypothetical protein